MREARTNQPSSEGDLPVDGRQCPEAPDDGTLNVKFAVFIKSSPEATPALKSQFSILSCKSKKQDVTMKKRIV